MKRIWPALVHLLELLPRGASRFFVGYVVVTCSMTVLDVVAMSLLALVIPAALIGSDVRLPVFGTFPADQAPVFILIACALIVLKSSLTLLMHWVSTRRFAHYELETGRRLFRAYVNSSWEERSKRTVAEITRISDGGIGAAVAGFIVPITLIPAAVTTFVLVLVVLIVNDPLTALIAFIYLGGIAALVNLIVTKRALAAGQINRDYSYMTANLMTEMVDALKELSLRGRLPQMVDLVTSYRQRSVNARRVGSFLGIMSTFAFEIGLIGGVIIIGATSYITSGLAGAAASVALFAATGFRLIPAINSIHAGIVQANATLPIVNDVLVDLVSAERSADSTAVLVDTTVLPEPPRTLTLTDVGFRYPGASVDVLRGLDLQIPFGSSLGIVGPSGAGKSTLIDLLLGLSIPTDGSIDIDDLPLREVLNGWRARVGYVPQRVALFDGTIAQNVALTWEEDFDSDRVVQALERAQLSDLVGSRSSGINERIGERGVSLSGGQQQRLGIARALYSDPLVLVLDEATSSLDTKTEDSVTQAIRGLLGELTLISVAHRLSTIKDYDRICYLDEGRILGQGTFAEVARSVPRFGEQVALAGLSSAVDRAP